MNGTKKKIKKNRAADEATTLRRQKQWLVHLDWLRASKIKQWLVHTPTVATSSVFTAVACVDRPAKVAVLTPRDTCYSMTVTRATRYRWHVLLITVAVLSSQKCHGGFRVFAPNVSDAV